MFSKDLDFCKNWKTAVASSLSSCLSGCHSRKRPRHCRRRSSGVTSASLSLRTLCSASCFAFSMSGLAAPFAGPGLSLSLTSTGPAVAALASPAPALRFDLLSSPVLLSDLLSESELLELDELEDLLLLFLDRFLLRLGRLDRDLDLPPLLAILQTSAQDISDTGSCSCLSEPHFAQIFRFLKLISPHLQNQSLSF